LRFTQPFAFNDPFETFPCFAGLPDDFIKDLLDKHKPGREELEKMFEESLTTEMSKQFGVKVPPEVIEAIKGSSFVQAGISQVYPMTAKLMTEFMSQTGDLFAPFTIRAALDAMNRQFGLLCLTEKPDNLLMWAHYAARHTGFLLEFDEKHSFFDRRETPKEFGRCLHKVTYVKTRPRRMLLDPRMEQEEFLADWAKGIFFSKSEHWWYEDEWRMIEYLKDCKHVIETEPHKICLFPLPMDCLIGIIFGCKTSEATKSIVRYIVANDPDCLHIRLSQATIDDEEYALNIRELT